jgi:predicted secreted protein
MLSTDRPEHAPDDGVFEDTKPACVALVPVAQEAQWSHPQVRRAPPDPTFVAQLIATAELLPQTQSLRRAATADALSAYRSHLAPKVQRAGSWMRQII